MSNRPAAPSSSPARAGEEAEALLEVVGVTRRYGGLSAVADVSLTLRPDERVAVIGPNGAGKTTLFKLIAGEVPVSGGSIRFDGQDVTRSPARRRARLGIARTFQVSNLFPSLTVEENVRLAAQARRPARWTCWPRPSGDIGRETDAAIEDLMLTGRRHSRVESLSHGERRQLEIAMALAVTPRLLLLDEPAAGLSLVERLRLRQILESLPRTVPFLLIEHDLTLALELADRVLCLDNGRTIAMGTAEEIRRDPFVREVYLGRTAAS